MNPTQHTIPTDAHLRGDFSDLLAIDPVRYQIYDPLSVRPDPPRPGFFIRDPFPGNIIPQSRIINPMYQHYIKFLPKPNNNPTDPRQEPTNNYHRAHLHRSDPEPDLRRAPRLQPLEHATGSSAGGAEATSPRGSTTGRTRAPHPFRRHEADDERGDRKLDVGEELVDRHRRAVEREHVSRRGRAEDAGEDRVEPRSGCRPTSTTNAPLRTRRAPAARAAARARCRASRHRATRQFGDNAAEGYDTHEHAVHREHDSRSCRPYVADSAPTSGGIRAPASCRARARACTPSIRPIRAATPITALVTPGNLGLSWAAFMLGIPTTSTINTPVDYCDVVPLLLGIRPGGVARDVEAHREPRPSLRGRAGDDRERPIA